MQLQKTKLRLLKKELYPKYTAALKIVMVSILSLNQHHEYQINFFACIHIVTQSACLIYLFSCFVLNHHPPSLSHNKAGLTFSDLEVSQPANNDKMRLYTLYAKTIRVPLLLYTIPDGSVVVVAASSTLTMISFDNFYSL